MKQKSKLSIRGRMNAIFKKKNKKAEIEDGSSRIIDDNSSFDTIETYKSIRTNILFSIPKTDDGKVIVISSSSPGEGKTTTSINLAITFAQTGSKIILLDCDLRKSRVHRYLKVKRLEGVSNILCGFSKLDSSIMKEVRPNLDVLTAGEIPPNPAELFASQEFENLLDELKKRYDYIFIDTPPLTIVTDASIIMQQCNGVVMSVRQNATSYDLLDMAMDDVERIGAKLLGVIMVDCDERKKKYGYYKKRKYGLGYKYSYRYNYYNYGYGYGYGDRYGDKKVSHSQTQSQSNSDSKK